ncbi:MAG TPA: tryptophan--tRNA ligase [Candidatus Paceibacterota bacterium]
MSEFAPKSNVLLTGDRPTGRLHLGHYVGSIKNRVDLQNDTSITKRFYMVADLQGLTDNFNNPEKIRDNVREVILDNLACGLDPEKTTIFIQSTIPFIAELTMLFMNLVTVSRLKRNPTVKEDIKEKNFGEAVPAGFLTFPISQAADILCVKADIVPVGADQMPHIEQTNEIGASFNRMYAPLFPYVKGVISEYPRLVGTDGNAKASKSLGNAIYLSDSFEEISKKVMSMYTDPNHVNVADPGKVEGNVVFTYLDIFDDKKDEVAELKAQYMKGGLGDVVLKKRLIDVLENVIAPIRAKREELEKNPEYIDKILKQGFETTMKETEKIRDEVREAVKLYNI